VKSLLLLALLQQGTLDPDLAMLVARVPAPRIGGPSVVNVVSSERLFAGDQLNVLTAAWLPRSLRLRLRQAPSLTPPVINGVWATPRNPVSGAVTTREGGDEAYDLFVVAQTVYPLNPGRLTIPAARLTWTEPTRGRSGEERHGTVASTPLAIEVRPLPTAGQPPQFAGPVGRDLRIEYRLTGSGRAGAVVPVEVAVIGSGSLPLWPAPTIAWPAGARAYDQGSDAAFGSLGTRLGGTRLFRFAMVPDSAGGLSLPPLEYPYFDPIASAYRVARAPGTIVPILEPVPVAARRAPVSLLQPGSVPLTSKVAALPGYVLWLLFAVPIVAIGAVLLGRRYPRKPRPAEPAAAPERLERLVRALLPPGTGPSRGTITAALRRAGLPVDRADRLARLHLALETHRYSGRDDAAEFAPGELDREIARALDAVPAKLRRSAGLAAAVLLALWPRPAEAQSGFELYNRGQYVAAAEAFRVEARQFPRPERWYNVAAAEYLSGRDAHAAAALLPVRAADPRDPRVRALWNGLAREHGELRRVGGRWPLTADECVVLGIVASWFALLLFLLARRLQWLWLGTLVLAGGGVLAGTVQRQEQLVPRAVLIGGVSQRVSPHGLAPSIGTIPAFTVVELERQIGNWWLVRSDNGAGWVPSEILAQVEIF
jgi:hypothetical protein